MSLEVYTTWSFASGFFHHSVFKAHPYCSVHRRLILFYCQIIFPCMGITHVIIHDARYRFSPPHSSMVGFEPSDEDQVGW